MNRIHLFFSSALLPDGWATAVRIGLAGGTIMSIETNAQPGEDDERHGPAIAGLPNLHSHAFQRAMAGLSEQRASTDDDFWTWREAMYHCVERLDPDDVEAVAAFAFMEMLESGITRVGEFHYLHHDPNGRPYANMAEMAVHVMAAAATAGIGLTLLPVFYAHSGFGGQAPHPVQRRFVTSLDNFTRLLAEVRQTASGQSGVVVGLAPHSLRAVTPDQLREISPLAESGPVHIHVAEQNREVVDCLNWSNQRPVAWLLDHQPVDNRWCLVHATHTTMQERIGIATSGAVVGLCPITEANLGDGVFEAVAFQKAGGRFGIGTDSNVLIDAAGELRQLEYSQRMTLRQRNLLAVDASLSTGRSLFDAAYRAGAQALGVSAGGLAVGQKADIVTFANDHPALVAREGNALLDSWIFATRCGAINSVWSRGRRVVTQGRHVLRDSIQQRFCAMLKRLRA